MTTFETVILFATALLSAASIALHYIAPRTKTTIDDDFLAKIDEVIAFIRGLPTSARPTVAATIAGPPARPVTVQVPIPGDGTGSRDPQSGRVNGQAMLIVGALIALGLVGGVALNGCAARQRVTAGVGAFLDCEAAHIDEKLLADAVSLAKSAVLRWVGGDGQIDAAGLKADLEPIKTDLGRCAFAGAIAAVSAPAPKALDAPMAAALEIDAAALRRAFTSARGELGWLPVRAAGGEVL